MLIALRKEDLETLLADLPIAAQPVVIDALSRDGGCGTNEMLAIVARLQKGRVPSVVVTTLALADALSAIGARMLAHRRIGPDADQDAAVVAFDVEPAIGDRQLEHHAGSAIASEGMVAAGIATKGDEPHRLREEDLRAIGERVMRENPGLTVDELLAGRRLSESARREDHTHELVETTKSRQLRVIKEEEPEERTVLGVVLEPDIVDSHGDTYTREEIRQAAFGFVEFFQEFKLQHESPLADGSVRLLESYLLPVACEIAGTSLPIGTWLMRVRVVDDQLWRAIKDGLLTAFSMGGSAIRRPLSPGELADRADRAADERVETT